MLVGMVRCDNHGVKKTKTKTKNIFAVTMIYSLITGICIITVCILIILKPIFSGLKKSWCGQELINGLARSWNKLGKYETI